METKRHNGNIVIAAERRRRILEWIRQYGTVEVVDLAESFGVGMNTIRNDLDVLQDEGKLTRVHGGAVIIETSTPRPPYIETRSANMDDKSRIAEAALAYVPDSGAIFIGAGSTTYQLAMKLPSSRQYHVVTNSIEVAGYLAAGGFAHVDILGGSIRSDSLASDGSLATNIFDEIFWEATFMGAAAIDLQRGITTLDWSGAKWERKLIEHAGRVIVLCDSSKLGRFSHGRVGPVSLIDVLITDNAADKTFIDEIRKQGVEVIQV
ncbi:MAG: DeoR/GlpR family DNA-binding transcription regulator [Armatimonadota bacterium]